MGTWLDTVRDFLDPVTYQAARDEEAAGRNPADLLLKGKHLTRGQVLGSLSTFHDLPAILLDWYEPQDSVLAMVPEETARRLGVLPLFILRESIYVAVSHPHNVRVEDWLVHLTGMPLEEIVTTSGSVEQAINRCYLAGGQSARTVEAISASRATQSEPVPASAHAEVRAAEEEAAPVKMVNHVLASAIRLGASDVHLEPFDDSVMLRYRVDGLLREYPPPPRDMMKAMVSRLKILSDLDVSEKRLPQDGRATYMVDGCPWDLRVSVIPNLYGESVVIRILNSAADRQALADLGFSAEMLERYRKCIRRPYGMVLVSGPTGSGKSTTLYATLREILSPEKKIITLEDPVESQIRGITQFQINTPVGFTFARALRSVLRHDPEVVLVGEIRDLETAEIAIRASLTGHLLFSTLHTNDALSAATRLIDMGVPGYMVMTSLVGVLAQRLVRMLCMECRESLEVTPGHLDALGLESMPFDATPCRPVGCSACDHLGYRGRSAIFEWMEINQYMRRLTPDQMTTDHMRELLAPGEFMTMRASALHPWFEGRTSLEEVMKVTVDLG